MSSATINDFTSPISLSQLAPRCWATVTDVATSPSDLTRLMGLGICTGRRLQLVKGGDPMILQVYGTRIGLSARLADLVRVVANVDTGDRG